MKHQSTQSRYTLLLWSASGIALVLWLGTSWLVTDYIMTSRIAALVREKTAAINLQADNTANNIFHHLNKLHGIPSLVSRDTDVLRALSRFGAGTYPKSLNVERRKEAWSKNVRLKTVSRYLNLVNTSLGLDVVYIINAFGDCIASSNADKPDSFVGSNYASREYFRVAMEGKPWHQYAMGKVSNIPGLFFSAPIVNEGHIVGVVTTKINLPELPQWVNLANAFIADQYGVIILASDAKLEMHALPDAALVGLSREARRTRYKREEFPVLGIKSWPGQLDTSLRRFDEENHPVILTDRMLAKDDISIHVFRRIPEIAAMAQEQLIQFMLLAISGSLAILFIRSRTAFDHIRKQTELSLRTSEESLRESQIIAGLGSYVLDIHSALWEGSDMLERLFGIDKAYDHSASGWQALIHPDDRTMMDDYLRNEVLGQGKAFDKEYRIIRQNDQAMRWVYGLGKLVFDTQGHPLKMHGTIQDITERKQAEQTAMDERNFSNTLIASQPDLFFVLDSAGRYIRWNDKVRDILGYSDTQIAATNALDTVHEADRPAVAQKIQEAFEQGTATIVARLVTKTGIRDYSFKATRADTAKGKYLIGIGTDITERMQAESELRESELAYRTLAQNLPGMVYRVFIREGGRMQFYNEMTVQITGYAVDELTTGKVSSIEPLILNEDRPGVMAEVMHAIAEKRAFAVDYRLKHKDGNIRWMAEHGMPVYGTDGAPLYIDGVIFDTTEHKRTEIKLKLFRYLIDSAPDEIHVVDNTTLRIIDANESGFVKLGYTREELLALHLPDVDTADPETLDAISEQMRNGNTATFETYHKRKDGVTFPVEVTAQTITLDRSYSMGIARDITKRKLVEAEVQRLQEQLREQAVRDPLTGLYNRRYLDETMERELVRAARYGHPIGIVMCDLDHFKAVNDTHGHLVGDEVLRVFAELLRKNSRGSDIICRFGGEEFLLFLPDMPPEIAYQRAEQLRTALAAKRITSGAAVIGVTASFGVAAFPENGKTQDALIHAADVAMYQAKEAGRNRVVASSARAVDGSGHT